MTFEGFIKLIYVSRNKNTKRFRKWATNIIYTYHFGTND